MEKVSILISTKDRRRFLERCLMGLWKTSKAEDVHYYICDDASSDDTADYLATLKNHPSFTVMRSSINCGTALKHTMLRMVKTDFILTIDDDIWMNIDGWPDLIDCFIADPKLGAIKIPHYNDERSEFGIDWGGKNFNSFTGMRFKHEIFLHTIPGTNSPPSDSHARYGKTLGGHWILYENPEINIGFGGCCAMWRVAPLRNYIWESEYGLLTDMATEWGKHLTSAGFRKGLTHEFVCYHAHGPWWHLGEAEHYWNEKSKEASVIYGRTTEDNLRWLQQARAWSGWGSGIPDINTL